MVFNAPCNNISVISLRSVLFEEEIICITNRCKTYSIPVVFYHSRQFFVLFDTHILYYESTFILSHRKYSLFKTVLVCILQLNLPNSHSKYIANITLLRTYSLPIVTRILITTTFATNSWLFILKGIYLLIFVENVI